MLSRLRNFFNNLIYRIKRLFIKKKEKEEIYPDYKDDLNKSFEKYIETNENYLQVANKFFSTSIDETQKSLLKNADKVINLHAIALLFTTVESINIFKRASNKITDSAKLIAELILWIEEREKENIETAERISNRKSDVGMYPVAMRLAEEQRFLKHIKFYLLGEYRVLLAYFQYIFEGSFKELPLPSLLEQFQKRHKQAKWWLALPFAGFLLNLFGFIDPLSFGVGVVGFIMFFVDYFYLSDKDIINLKKMPALAQEAQAQLEIAKRNIDSIRIVRDFIVDRETFIPTETIEVIDALKMKSAIESKIIRAQCEMLNQKTIENENKDWPGIGAILSTNRDELMGNVQKSKRKINKGETGKY